MHHLAIKAVAAALVVGAGTGAVTRIGSNADNDIPRDVLNPMIAGQAMLTSASIYDNVSKSPEHTVFVHAIAADGLAEKLSSDGAYTIFAPTNAAYAALAHGDAAQAWKAARYLIVAGRYDSQTLLALINSRGGEAKLKTIGGGTITAMLNGPTNIALMDERGRVADISVYDVYQRNGVVQVIDQVLLPRTARS